MQQGYLRALVGRFSEAEVFEVPLQAEEVIGLDAIDRLVQEMGNFQQSRETHVQ